MTKRLCPLLRGEGGLFVRGIARTTRSNDQAISHWEDEGGAITDDRVATTTLPDVTVGASRFSPRLGAEIATGEVVSEPEIAGLADIPYWTNRDIVQLTELPDSIAILGGGAIAVELGKFFVASAWQSRLWKWRTPFSPTKSPRRVAYWRTSCERKASRSSRTLWCPE